MEIAENNDQLLKNKRERNTTKETKEKVDSIEKSKRGKTVNKKSTKPIVKRREINENRKQKNKVGRELDKDVVSKASKRTRARSNKQTENTETPAILESIDNFDNEMSEKEVGLKPEKRIRNSKRKDQKAKTLQEPVVNEETNKNKKNKSSKKKTKESQNKEEIFNPILQNFINEENPKQNSNQDSDNLIPEFNKQNQIEKEEKEKTLLDFINDSKSGVPMKVAESEKINNIQASAFSKEKSKKSSMTLSCSNLSEMMVNNLERETYKFLKPKVIIEADGSMRIEKPNYTEIAQKIQDENFKKNFPYIVHNNEKHKITSSSFRKSSHSDKWSEQETQLFYEALRLFGCNFSYLEIILKPRSRDQIKKKFTREEKYNKEKIEEALIRNRTSDLTGNKNKDSEKHKLFKFANILKNFKEETKKEEKNKSKKNKYSRLNQDSDVTLSNYDNAEIYDFYKNDKEKITSARVNSNVNLKENESGSKIKDKKDKGDNVIKNVDNLYSKILFDEEVSGKHSLSQENFKKLINELEEKSQSDNESDEDSIEREKEKYKNYAANTRSLNKAQENNIKNNIIDDKGGELLNNKAFSSSTQNRKEALNKKVEQIIETNKEMKAIIEANKNVDSTQQVFDFLANFK